MFVHDYCRYDVATVAIWGLTFSVPRITSQLLWRCLARPAGNRTADCGVPVASSYDERENAHRVLPDDFRPEESAA